MLSLFAVSRRDLNWEVFCSIGILDRALHGLEKCSVNVSYDRDCLLLKFFSQKFGTRTRRGVLFHFHRLHSQVGLGFLIFRARAGI